MNIANLAPIDIFIPYWGEPSYAKETIRSVLAQSNPAWQLTVVDDAYPSLEIADFVAELGHPRVRYVRKAANAGITENYRTCVAMATQPITVLLGCDDRLLPDYVERILQAQAFFPDAAIIQPGVRVIDERGTVVRPLVDRVKMQVVRPKAQGYQLLGGESLAANLLSGDWLYWPSLAFRTDRLQATPFRDGFPVTQDLALVMDLVFAGERLLTFPEVCFEYRRHQESASSLKLLDGSRFAAERSYFAVAADIAQGLGWKLAERAAKARLTSRAHALTLLPQAIRRADLRSARTLVRHGFGS